MPSPLSPNAITSLKSWHGPSSIAWRLAQLGWTQQEIADNLGVTERTVLDDRKNSHLGKISDDLGDTWNDKGLAEVARRLRDWTELFRSHEGWRALTDTRGRPFVDFADFCQARPPAGLGTTPTAIEERIAKAAAETTGEVQSEGRPKLGTVPSFSQEDRAAEHGITRRTQGRLDRLARERPDLKGEIEAGRLSVKRAAIIAGFEPEKVSVPKDPEAAAAALARHFHGDALVRLVQALAAAPTTDSPTPDTRGSASARGISSWALLPFTSAPQIRHTHAAGRWPAPRPLSGTGCPGERRQSREQKEAKPSTRDWRRTAMHPVRGV